MVVHTDSIELSREEIVERLEAGARRYGMTAPELLRAYFAGQLADPGAVSDLIALSYLLPDDDALCERRSA